MNDIAPNTIINLSLFFSEDYLIKYGLDKEETFEACVNKLCWGVRDQVDRLKVEYRRLKDLSSDHLLNILITQTQINVLLKNVIKQILKERHNIGDE